MCAKESDRWNEIKLFEKRKLAWEEKNQLNHSKTLNLIDRNGSLL